MALFLELCIAMNVDIIDTTFDIIPAIEHTHILYINHKK